VYVGIGSNMNTPSDQVRAAIDQLRELPATQLIKVSRLFASKPMGPVAQPDFVNAVAGLLSTLMPKELLHHFKVIERNMGRTPSSEKWGPRVIDLDLLLYGQQQFSDTELSIPHPGIAQRDFVIMPLYEIAPALHIPGIGMLADLYQKITHLG
jgi:2-amino-4-hydroxy-6-hydroxymethyldihydropteridine diphosphokinase